VANLSTFIEKARRYRSDFIVGIDTAKRIVDPRYYDNGSPDAVDRVMEEFKGLGTTFFVFRRVVVGGGPSEGIEVIPERYRALFCELPGEWDVSSTQLRRGGTTP
jgi:hypothetical protein